MIHYYTIHKRKKAHAQKFDLASLYHHSSENPCDSCDPFRVGGTFPVLI